MRNALWLVVAALSATTSFAQKKMISLDDLYKKPAFNIKGVPGFNAMHDGRHYTQLDEENKHKYIRVYDLATGKVGKTLFDNGTQLFHGEALNIEEYTFSKDEKKMLLMMDNEHIYRRSVLYHVYVYDIASSEIVMLDRDKVLHATLSPDGTKVAYVKNNNLYYKDLKTNEVVQITNDGQKNSIINGNCDWVYEEEFSFTKAFEWNKDGSYLAWYRFDESKVPEYTMAKYTGLYPEQYTFKYPKAGERNSVIEIKIYDVNNRSVARADVGEETDQYVPRIKWTENPKKLCIYRLNRLQNKLELLLTSATTGSSKIIYKERNKWYINVNDEITFLPDGHSMILGSERDGWNHLYKYNWEKDKMMDLTEGNYDVESITGVDVDHQLLYYTAAEESPMQRNLYVVGLDGRGKKCITPEKGMHNITPCEGFNYFLDKYSTLNKVPVYRLRNAQGHIVRTLEDNHELAEKMSQYAWGEIKLKKFMGATGKLNGWMITPPDFDEHKQYPVLMYQYSGPGSQEVADKFPVGNYWWHQMLAQKGYIIVCVDGTGTGYRGEAFRKKTYLTLGKYESEDQIAVAKNLATLPYVDKNRIGIWGWSYGGFMSSTCIMKGNDVFKTAIAVAPVTNWRYYDNIYTERYMRTPQENASGYDDNSPVNMVDKLKGKFLFIHGTGDDNVHFQNSAMLTTALIKADKDYDSEYYPDKSHGISGGNTRNHLYRRMTEYILENL